MEIGISELFAREKFDRKVSVAPMMDWTDRHCRYFLRGFSPRVLLYTEMVTAAAITHGKRERLLAYSDEERPLALQLGGSEPATLAAAARIGAELGYDEINLNCGCPSDRVHAGSFGACLMLEPERVAECVAAMRAVVRIPVTVKMRIGVIVAATGSPAANESLAASESQQPDVPERSGGGGSPAPRRRLIQFDERDYERLFKFTTAVAAAGCRHVIVHARAAVLGALSPRENREVPPLRFEVPLRLKQDFPQLWLGVNGGLRDAAQCEQALAWADGVMLGREAYHRPQVLSELHGRVFADGWSAPDRTSLLQRMGAYAEREVARGTPLRSITRHMLGLMAGHPGARRYRQLLSQGAGSPRQLLREAAACGVG